MPPSHAHRNSDVVHPVVTAGFTPGGHIPAGYSYLQRSHSLLTPSRRTVPRGLNSSAGDPIQPSSEKSSPVIASPRLQHSSSSTSLVADNLSSPRLAQPDMDAQILAALVAELPPNPKVWTPSQVALYLTHVLGLTPRPVVEDLTTYVRKSRMGGKVFMRLREKDLAAEGLNLKWRKLMIEAVKKLRRDCLRGKIWGFEGGLQLPRQEDEMFEDDDADDIKEKPLPVTAKGTLKRLRDKKAIRSMISSFESAQHDNSDDSDTFVALGLRSRGSVSSLHSSDSGEKSQRPVMAPIYGEGYVKSRAESFSSLSDAEAQGTYSNRFTKAELEHWFGSLSEKEAEALADELLADEELLQRQSTDGMQRHAHDRSSSSTHSSISGASGPFTPPALQQAGFDLTPLDPSIVESAMGNTTSQEDEVFIRSAPTPFSIEPLRRDVLIDGDDSKDAPSRDLEAHLRPGLANGGKSNPYRSSTYDIEEMEALGLLPLDVEGEAKFGTARKLSRPTWCEKGDSSEQDQSSARDSVRIRHDASNLPSAMQLFPESVEGEEQQKETTGEHMRHMSAHQASGFLPYKPLSPAVARRASQKKKACLDKQVESAAVVAQPEEGKTTTIGRKGGVNTMQLSALLRDSGIADGPSHSDDGKKAEDEREWGVTMSRKASRRGTMGRSVLSEKEGAGSRLADLFAPTAPLAVTPFTSQELNEDNLKKLEADMQGDKLCVPLTTLEASDDGKGSIKKRSMVLVDRKRFQSLARRMGVLETQLAELEAASLPPLSDLGSMASRKNTTPALEDAFRYSHLPLQDRSSESEPDQSTTDQIAQPWRGWRLPMLFGAIPSYALGLGAGVGFVLLSEVLGKSRH